MSNTKGLSMSELITMHNELADKLGVAQETSFKTKVAASAAINALELKMEQATNTPVDVDFDPSATDGIDGMDVATTDKSKYNSSGKRGPTQGVGAYAKELLVADPLATNSQIVELVKERFPTAKTTAGCIAYYRTAMAKAAKAEDEPASEDTEEEVVKEASV